MQDDRGQRKAGKGGGTTCEQHGAEGGGDVAVPEATRDDGALNSGEKAVAEPEYEAAQQEQLVRRRVDGHGAHDGGDE